MNEFLKTRQFFWDKFINDILPTVDAEIAKLIKRGDDESLRSQIKNIYSESFQDEIV